VIRLLVEGDARPATAGWALVAAGIGAALALGWVLPRWLTFVVTQGLAKGLAVMGVVLLMRAGLVSFGQGLYYAGGAYAVGFAARLVGLREATGHAALGVAAGVLLGALVGVVVARYRSIFFAMLTLAFSMVLYGVLIKAYTVTGGSDGMPIPLPTLLGLPVPADRAGVIVYDVTIGCVALAVYVIARYLASPLGFLMRAIRDNEVRVQYLGGSVRRAIYRTYVLAAGLAALGGVLGAFNVGHIDPDLAYWTTSGEFVFVTLIGGLEGVGAPLGGAVAYELVKSYAFKYAPYAWEMVVGIAMLVIIFLFPEGVWVSLARRRRRTSP
jgi:ABC-type branched-subunit amino acid transport system permease subunit